MTTGTLATGYVKWFEEDKLNVCYNCVDRHLKNNGNKKALIWEGDRPQNQKTISFNGLHTAVHKFEGVTIYPSQCRLFQVIDKYQMNIFCIAPTAIRALQAEVNEAALGQTERDSLRILGTVGEPINRDAWK